MKIIFTIFAVILLTVSVFAQSPEKMSYQAVVRDASNALVTTQAVGMQISILQGGATGTPVYVETQTPTTNANGLVSLEIGSGTVVSGTFTTIVWANGPYFIKTETDPTGGTNYTITGTSQLLSVPYALHAKTAETITGGISEIDPVFATSVAYGITGIDTISWNNKLDYEVDGSITNELQVLTISNDTIYLSSGGFVKLPLGFSGDYNDLINQPAIPTVVTVGTSAVSYATCMADGNVTSNGGEFVVSRGICLSSQNNPTIADTSYAAGSGQGTYNIALTQLAPDHTYYVRAYATNVNGTSYGNELSFHTLPLTIPTLTTNAVYNISHTTAMSGGNISDDGGTVLLERGICWSLSSPPTITDNIDPEGNDVGNFNAFMSALAPATLYYVRAYATNAQGTAYGNELSFTTNVLSLSSITTVAVSAVSYSTATSGGNVTSDNGSPVTSRGICWATTTSPTTANTNYTEAGGLGIFSANLTALSPNTTYYVRAFAINGAGTVYGNEYSFTTMTLTAPVLTTKAISGISSNIAGSGGTISSDGGSAITAKGVCWSINPLPSLANSFTTDGTGSASYNSTMTGLNPLTAYYVRAYATNASGTTYANEVNFTTTDLTFPGPSVPTVGTSASAINGSTTASSGGYVSADGGSAVNMRGVCWSTSANPTLADDFSVDGGTGTGFFTSTVTGLSGCGVIYYIRAYATNSTGTGYGNQNTVSTGLLATLSTEDATNISYYSATSGGNITDEGGCPITEKGVCWSTSANPTIGNWKTTEGAGSGVFASNITGLYANVTYYVRAYSTNSVGTTYGTQKVFTTASPSTLYLGQNYAGGIIFYLDGTGEHGLVCAPSDQGDYEWGCSGTLISGTGTAIGEGAVNTATIVAGCGEANRAAKICDDLVLSSYSDWFLPSKDELNLMYVNLHTQGLGGFANSPYWSSSEFAENSVWRMEFYDNGWGSNWGTYSKYMSVLVRAVRAF